MTILITGVAGFIGSNFANQFKAEYPHNEIVGIDNFSSGRKEALPSGITFYEGSIVDTNLLEKIFSTHKPECVFHFAAMPRVSYSIEHPVETTDVNVTGTVALLSASNNHKVKRFIMSSSSSIYGGAKSLPTKESDNLPDPKSPYAVQKYCNEVFCKMFSDLYGLDTVCLRYFNVYGPGQYGESPYSTVISAWLEALYFPDKKKAFIEGDGTNSRDFCFVDNVILANMLAMRAEDNFKGEVYNIAQNERISINEIRDLIEKFTGRQLNLEHRPPRMGDIAHTHADISKATGRFGYKPQTNFRDGLEKTIAWFKWRTQK